MAQEPQSTEAAQIDELLWTDGINPVALRRMAKATRQLLEKPERWIHRRVERIYFKDHEVVHHQVSVDFTLPRGLKPVSKFEDKEVHVAPLFLLAKNAPKPLRAGKRPRKRFIFFGQRSPLKPTIPVAPYSNISFTDQTGLRLPLLTRRQSSQLSETVLIEEAERVLECPVTERIEEELSAIAYRDWLNLDNSLKWLFDEIAYCDLRIVLRRDERFTEMVNMLASHSLIICLILDGTPRRPIYKLSYDEPANDSKSTRLKSFLRGLGWISEEYAVRLNEIGAGSSYHLEVEVPKELEINTVGLVGKHYSYYSDLEDVGNRDYFIQQVERTSEGKIYIPRTLPRRRVGLAWVKLRARRSGLLVGAFAVSTFTTAQLALATWGAPNVLSDGTGEAAAAALLLVPVLVVAYIVRPGEHPITSKILSWARRMLMLNALLPTLAVFFLITTQSKHGKEVAHLSLGPLNAVAQFASKVLNSSNQLRGDWAVLACVSAILTVLFAFSYWLPKPNGDTIYEPMPEG